MSTVFILKLLIYLVLCCAIFCFRLDSPKLFFSKVCKCSSYRLVQPYRPKFIQSPMSMPFLRGRPWIFAHVFLYKHPLEHLEAARSEKNVVFFPAVNAWLILTSLKACDWSGHVFGASASPRSLTKKLTVSPSSTVHDQHTKYVTFELLFHAAIVANEIWGDMLELVSVPDILSSVKFPDFGNISLFLLFFPEKKRKVWKQSFSTRKALSPWDWVCRTLSLAYLFPERRLLGAMRQVQSFRVRKEPHKKRRWLRRTRYPCRNLTRLSALTLFEPQSRYDD